MSDSTTGPEDDARGGDAADGQADTLVQLDSAETWRREYNAHLQAAIAALAAGARLRRPVIERGGDGGGDVSWGPHPTKTEPSDWAEFVALAVAGAAGDVGGVEAALAGRPRSWEADNVRRMVASTVDGGLAGPSGYGTDLIFVRVSAASILEDLMEVSGLYDESHQILSREWDAAATVLNIEFDERPFVWPYRIEAQQGVNTMVPVIEDAPAFDAARWREDLVALGVSGEGIASVAAQREDPNSSMFAVFVSRDDVARAGLVDLRARRWAVEAPYQQRMQVLEDQQDRERAAYALRLQVEIEAEAARRFPGLEVVVDVDLDRYAAADIEEGRDKASGFQADPTPEAQLLDHARTHTPLPGSGLAPIDYPDGVSIADVEREAGRLPHTRLDAPLGGAWEPEGA